MIPGQPAPSPARDGLVALASVEAIVVHHTATPWDGGDDAVERIRELHVRDRGFADIGYHLLVCPDGDVRHGRPLWAQGAHVLGHNRRTVGIAVVGDFRCSAPPAQQLDGLHRAIALARAAFGEVPVLTHSDLADTECPGERLREALEASDRHR